MLALWRTLHDLLELKREKEEDGERNTRGIVHGSFKSLWKNGKALNYAAVMEINSFALKHLNSLILTGARHKSIPEGNAKE